MKTANHLLSEAAPSGLPATDRVRLLLERLVVIYQRAFEKNTKAQEYLRQQGLTAPEVWAGNRIGYSDGTLQEILPSDASVLAELVALGVLSEKAQERLAGCLIVPVCDSEGGVVTLIGHAMTAAGPDDVFLTGIAPRIWNAAACRTHSRLLAVHSVLDALGAQTVGFRNAIAVPNAVPAPEDLALFRTHGVEQITLVVKAGAVAPSDDQALITALREFRCERASGGPFEFRLAFSTQEIDVLCLQALTVSGFLPATPAPIRIDRLIEKHFCPNVGYEELHEGYLGYTAFDTSGGVVCVRVSARLEDGHVRVIGDQNTQRLEQQCDAAPRDCLHPLQRKAEEVQLREAQWSHSVNPTGGPSSAFDSLSQRL